MKKRILFLILHRKDRSPGQRYRHEQYVSHLEANGFQCQFSPMLNERQDRIFYGQGNLLAKVIIGLKSFLKRWKDVRRAGSFDYVYIYRDAFFFGSFIERWIAARGAQIIYDFDDAIWLKDENPNQGILNKLKTPGKVPTIISLSHRVIVGSPNLAKYARQFNDSIMLIPSTIDPEKYSVTRPKKDRICIGWTGSFSTLKHFESVIPALEKIKGKYGDQVYFKVIGVPDYQYDGLDIKGVSWNSHTEAEDLAELDIGIMPLPDNPWTQGKCAMKALQYMALGIPAVLSPVGVNVELIQDGQNGLLATTAEQWVDKLSLLIESRELATTIGDRGRETVLAGYTIEANKEKWLGVFSD